MSVEQLKKDFKKLIEGDTLAHGYLLFGHESGVGKKEFSESLANFLESGEWEVAGRQLSDFRLLDAGKDGGIEMIREASRFLWQRPVISKRRCLVIDNADRLTLPAQHAILKIAEEPPASALILLLLKDPAGILPAVISRFQRIFVAKDGAGSAPNISLAKEFLSASALKRKELLKKLLEEIKESEDDSRLDIFVSGLFFELKKDPIRNLRPLKALLTRWSLIRQFSVNKKLQLEAALANI